MNDLKSFLDALNSAPITIIGVLAFIVFAAYKGYWVPGYIYREKCAQSDRQTTLAEKATDISEALTRERNGRHFAHDE